MAQVGIKSHAAYICSMADLSTTQRFWWATGPYDDEKEP